MYYREAGTFPGIVHSSMQSDFIIFPAGAFVVYDITDSLSFEKAKTWIIELKKNQPSCLIMLLGNQLYCLHPFLFADR